MAAAPAVGALLLAASSGGPAHAATQTSVFVGRNVHGVARILSTGSAHPHKLQAQLSAVAGDGSVAVLRAHLTDARTGAVVVDEHTGVGRIEPWDPTDPGVSFYAGDGSVVVDDHGTFSVLDVSTGLATSLAAVPALTGSDRRTVTAVAATAGGAIVATADATRPGTSGTLDAADLWKLTPGGAQHLSSYTGAFIPAVASNAAGVDAISVTLSDDHLSLVHLDTTGETTTAVGARLAGDVSDADLAYGTRGGQLVPVLTLTASSGTTVVDLDGTVIRQYEAGTELFVSAGDINDPASVVNPLTKVAQLSGVPDGTVPFGTRVTPQGTAVASGVIGSVPASAVVTMTTSNGHGGAEPVRTLDPNTPVVLNKTTTFTVSSPATTYTTQAPEVTRTVQVAHKLLVTHFSSTARRGSAATSAAVVKLQVRKNGAWKTVKTLHAHRGLVRFRVPTATARLVADRTPTNARAVVFLGRG
jgi:hypothetical protein